jgi:hypothetical protein
MTTLIAAQAIERSPERAHSPIAVATTVSDDRRWAEWSDRYARDDRRTRGQMRIAATVAMAAALVWVAITLV